ncbi:MAG: hypothetical protein ACYTBX_20215, partial [Planctomycetota bacterium]
MSLAMGMTGFEVKCIFTIFEGRGLADSLQYRQFFGVLSTPKTAPFSCVGAYNRYTTRKPVISQFNKNGSLISHLTKATYKKVEIWQRIQ